MSIAAFALASLLLLTPLWQATPVPPAQSAIPPLIWELVELTVGQDQAEEIAEPARYTVQFLPDGKLAIGADCNRATGGYEAADGTLKIGLLASTLALCPPDSRSEPFLGVLQGSTSFVFDDDGYLLLEGDGGALRLQPTVQGVVWEWQEFAGGDDSIVKPKNPVDYTLTFLPDGKLAIKADCNRAFGTYTLDDPKIDLAVGGVTRMLCPEGTLMNEFLRDLDAASSFVFREGNLHLALPVDAGILTFHARFEEPAKATPQAG